MMRDLEYPRPQFVRSKWKSLNGTWSYSFSDVSDPAKIPWQGWIKVPFPPESPFSGVNDPGYHPVIWYQRRFDIPTDWHPDRVLLHFGAVDYLTRVWVNGRFVIEHEGGHTPFTADITDVLVEGEQIITVRVQDDPLDMEKPRGKQDWEIDPHSMWYPRTTGIWQPVWIEPVSQTRIANIKITPDIGRFALGLDIYVEGLPGDLTLDVRLSRRETLLAEDSWRLSGLKVSRWISLPDPGADSARKAYLWSPENPILFDLHLSLRRGDQVVDRVESYTALRSVEARDHAIYLNGRTYFFQMVLDQGYWPESHLAAPSGESLKRDVELAKELGFNGVIKHQKLEDPRYLYWADVLGLLVWVEMPSFYCFSRKATSRLRNEFTAAIERDYNHPCIVAWVPFNESWGLPDLRSSRSQRHYLKSLYHLAKSLDPTRLVIDNDGWEHVRTDVLTIHDYLNDPDVIRRRYGDRAGIENTLSTRPLGRDLILEGFPANDPPIVLSGFGGIRLKTGEGWGYAEAKDPNEYLQILESLIEAVSHSMLAGYCYTQLVDTFQEQNGLLYPDRTPKVEPDAIAQVIRTGTKQRLAAES